MKLSRNDFAYMEYVVSIPFVEFFLVCLFFFLYILARFGFLAHASCDGLTICVQCVNVW